MKHIFAVLIILVWCANLYTIQAQKASSRKTVNQNVEQSDAILDKFSRKSEKRTEKARRRMARYKRKLTGDTVTSDRLTSTTLTNDTVASDKEKGGLGKEPMLDSLRLVQGFAQQSGLSPGNRVKHTGQSIDRAQVQLDVTQRTKAELHQRKEYWKAQLKEHPEYARTVGRMEKEEYYYTAQINEYRKALRDPSLLDDKLMATLRKDPRFSDFLTTLPAKPQDPAKMQPKDLVQQMMQSQAAAIDPEPAKLISDAKKKGSELLGDLSQSATEIGNLDNATQVPTFTPNPYKTKNFWERIDIGFDLQFARKTFNLPSSGTAGAQASFNFSQRWSAGLLANYRFGMGDIKHIKFSSMGAGYGAFANYKLWKGLGVQAGFERNWRKEVDVPDSQPFPAVWTSSALAGITWEYSIGKKAKGTIGVFFDALYKQHTPQTNAVLWRMGWKF